MVARQSVRRKPKTRMAPTRGTTGTSSTYQYVSRNQVTVEDFIVCKDTRSRPNGGNQHSVAHQNLDRIRDVIYVVNNYPSLRDDRKLACHRMLFHYFQGTGGRMLKPDGNDDGYYIISDREERTMIATMFCPNLSKRDALEELIRQHWQQHPPVAPIVMDQPNHSLHCLEYEMANYILPDEDDDE